MEWTKIYPDELNITYRNSDDMDFRHYGDFGVVTNDDETVQIAPSPGQLKFIVIFGSLFLPFFSCLLYTSPSPRDQRGSRMPSSA